MNAFDSRILIWLNGYATASARFDHLVAWVSLQHLVKGAVVAAVLCGLWFARRTQPERALLRERLLATLAAGLVAEIVARTLALSLPFRTRPLHNPQFPFTPTIGLESGFLDSWSAFPSDHAVLFFALATGALYASRRVGAWLLVYVAVVICLPRIYLGLHHPTDILAGAAFGIGTAALLQQPALRVPLARPLLAWEQRSPGSFYAFGLLLHAAIRRAFRGRAQPAGTGKPGGRLSPGPPSARGRPDRILRWQRI